MLTEIQHQCFDRGTLPRTKQRPILSQIPGLSSPLPGKAAFIGPLSIPKVQWGQIDHRQGHPEVPGSEVGDLSAFGKQGHREYTGFRPVERVSFDLNFGYKKDSGFRLIRDLRELNQFIKVLAFVCCTRQMFFRWSRKQTGSQALISKILIFMC